MYIEKSARRSLGFGRRLALVVAGLVLAGMAWAGCGGGSDDGGDGEKAASNPGVPQVDVKFGMQPFGDHTIYVAGMTNGWYEDVGINIQPQPLGREVPPGEATQMLLSGELDLVTEYTPLAVQEMGQVPDVKVAGFDSINFGTFVFANPDLNLKTLEERMEEGQSLEEAMADIGDEMRGKNHAVEASGFHRIFYNTVQKLGGIDFSKDLNLSVLEDPQIIQQALGGKLDFASPAGVAQMVQLFQEGWTPLVSLQTFVEELPAKQTAPMLGNSGWKSTDEYLKGNHDTVLRFTSVMFRIIDAITTDPAGTLGEQAEYLARVGGTDIGVEGLEQVLLEIDPLGTFEDQADWWVNKDSNYYFENLYQPQIAAAQAGGVLPKGKDLKATDLIVGNEYYQELVDLKAEYDDKVKQLDGADLSGDKQSLADAAASQYDAFNYLDAVRLLEEALG